VQRHRAVGTIAEIGVTGLSAEVGQVDQRHGIGRADTKDRSGGKRQKPFACAEHGEGAEKPLAIHDFVPIRHAGGVAGARPWSKVTTLPRLCDGLTR
jgi:hypothetical protein